MGRDVLPSFRSRLPILLLWIAPLLVADAPLRAQYGPEVFHDDFESGDTNEWGTDEERLRRLIAATAPAPEAVHEVLRRISFGDGLPVHTHSGTWIFAADCGGEAWQLAGEFNSWTPEPMTVHGSLCWDERSVPSPEEAGYKFVDSGVYAADPWARHYRYDDFGELSLVRASQGHLERWVDLGPEHDNLAPRQLRVWVPDGGLYDRVLFAQDAQNLFDPNALFGGWHLDQSVPAGVLVVGIDSSPDRLDEFTPYADDLGGGPVGGGGDSYAELVHLFARPFIERRYGGFQHYGLLGASLGGVISLHIADRYPDDYQFVASLSGTLGFGSIGPHNRTVIEDFASAGHRTLAIYIDSGGSGTCSDADADGIEDDGTDSDNYCVNLQLRDVLVGAGYQLSTDLWYVWASGAQANEAAWAARVGPALAHFAAL